MTNPDAENPLARFLLSRAPGILFATAALLVSFSGVAAPDLGATHAEAINSDPATALIEVVDTDAPAAADAADASEAADTATSTDVPRLSFTTGDRLTEAQLAEYQAYIEALKAKGQHRGVSVMQSW